MARLSRFKKRVSDRSGFDYYEHELVRDKQSLVGSDELDTPPPSDKPLGGEGDINQGDMRASTFASITETDTPSESDNPTVYITAAGGITPSFVHPWMNISGSNGTVNITADPQIVLGREGQILTIQCVDSSVTLDHGTGLNMMGSGSLLLSSGSIVTFYYSTANNVWNEASRFRP